MKKLLFVFFVFVMFSCEKAMDDVRPFETQNEENFRLKSDTTQTTPGDGDDDNNDVIVDP